MGGASAQKMMDHLQQLVDSNDFVGKKFKGESKEFVVSKADNFEYTDPIDKSVTKKQGIRIFFADGSRIVFRLSGTGSSGATVRMYVETYTSSPFKVKYDTQDFLEPLVKIAMEVSKLQ